MAKINEKEKNSISKPRLRYSLVAYVDFLGTKGNMNSDTKYLNTVLELYDDAIRMISDKEGDKETKINYKSFSDNIVFSMHLEKNPITIEQMEKDRKVFDTLFAFICAFQRAALKKGYLIRGGITCGDFYLNEKLVWGDALIKAVQLEENVAIYPRVVVDEDLRSLKIQTVYYSEMVEKDEDQVTYINFLNDEENNLEEYKGAYSNFNEKHDAERNPRIKQKYGWILSYMKNHINNL